MFSILIFPFASVRRAPDVAPIQKAARMPKTHRNRALRLRWRPTPDGRATASWIS